jgi:hypothetical protein
MISTSTTSIPTSIPTSLPTSILYKKISDRSKYDISKLQQEAEALTTHYYPQKGSGLTWQGVPLRNATGTTEAEGIGIIRAFKGRRGGGMKNCVDSNFMEKAPYIRSILDEFEAIPAKVFLVRLLRLSGNSNIKRHRDGPNFVYTTGPIARFHIPIITNPEIKMYWEERGKVESLYLEEGYLHYTNVSGRHWVENPTSIERVHLVIDVENNEKIKELIER